MKHVYEGRSGGWAESNLFPNNFQCSAAVRRGWPPGIMYTRGLAGLSSRGAVPRAKGKEKQRARATGTRGTIEKEEGQLGGIGGRRGGSKGEVGRVTQGASIGVEG